TVEDEGFVVEVHGGGKSTLELPPASTRNPSGVLAPPQDREGQPRQEEAQQHQAERRQGRDGRGGRCARHLDGGGIGGTGHARIVGLRRRFVGAVAVGVISYVPLVRDRLAGGAGEEGGGDGDRPRAAGSDRAVPGDGVG